MVRPKIVFVSSSAQKISDVRYYLGDAVEIESAEIDLPELQGTVEEIAKDKCRKAANTLQRAVLVEDDALCFPAMGNLPGPYIKWFLTELGVENLHKMLAGFDDKSADITVTFAYSQGPGHEPLNFQEQTHGKLVPPRGPASVGFHQAFEYEGRTFAQMTRQEMSKISSRRRALMRLHDWMLEDMNNVSGT